MAEFRDIIITPEDTVLDLYRYSDTEKNHSFTLIIKGDEHWYLSGRVETQLLRHLGLTIEGMEALPTDKRKDVFSQAFNKPLIIKCINEYPYAVVTPDYTTIRHRQIWNWAEDILEQRQVYFKKIETFKVNNGLLARYVTDQWRSKVNRGFYITNSVKGQGGISYGESVYIRDVYLTGEPLFTIAHSGGADRIEDEFKSLFSDYFFSFYIEVSETIKFPYGGLLNAIDIPMKYKRAAEKRLSKVSGPTNLDAAIALAAVAQVASPRNRLMMERLAYKEVFNEVHM